VSFDNYAFEFKNDATFTSSGAYTAKLTMIMNGKEYTTEEAVPYSSASGNYAAVGDILYLENGSKIKSLKSYT
jgi:hypothetical protein